jgi:hypothetical protein
MREHLGLIAEGFAKAALPVSFSDVRSGRAKLT